MAARANCLNLRVDGVRRILAGALSFVLVLTQTGCLTPKLWSKTRERSFREPAPDPHLAIHAAPDRNDVLVSYDELGDGKISLRRRAFYLRPNLSRIAVGKKPEFVKPELATTLLPVAIAAIGGAAKTTALHAVTEKHGHRFTLHEDAQTIGPVELPVYQTYATEWGRVALTPFAVAGDIALIGAFGVFMFGYGLATSGGSVIAP